MVTRTDSTWMEGFMWPWKRKKGRTVESYNKRGRLRVLCIAGGSPVTGEITIRTLSTLHQPGGADIVVSGFGDRLGWEHCQSTSRRTQCPECGFEIGVTGPKTAPRLYVHNAVKPR
jgi:hypothetical protein